MRDDLDPPHVDSDQPLPLPLTIRAKDFARKFRSAAVTFREMGRDGYDPFITTKRWKQIPPGGKCFTGDGRVLGEGEWIEACTVHGTKPSESTLKENCGRWIIQAHDLGLFPDLVELRELVAFHKTPTPDFATSGRKTLRTHCPYNLFIDVCGGNMVLAKFVESSDDKNPTLDLVKDERGRIVQCGGLMPRLSPGHLKLSPVEKNAQTCEMLADIVEHAAVQHADGEPADPKPEHALIALFNVHTNGIASDRIERVYQLLAHSKLTVNEKLFKIDALLPFPPTASAEQLGGLVGKTKQAVMKTEWWKQNRKGEKGSEIGRRRDGYLKRGKEFKKPATMDDEW